MIRVLFEKKGGCGTKIFPICLSVTKHLGFLCSDYSRILSGQLFIIYSLVKILDKLHRSKFV